MKKKYLNVSLSQLNCLADKIEDKFSITMEKSYNGKKEFMGAKLVYKYDKNQKTFYVDLSIGFPANMSYSEDDVLSQFEGELVKCGWNKN